MFHLKHSYLCVSVPDSRLGFCLGFWLCIQRPLTDWESKQPTWLMNGQMEIPHHWASLKDKLEKSLGVRWGLWNPKDANPAAQHRLIYWTYACQGKGERRRVLFPPWLFPAGLGAYPSVKPDCLLVRREEEKHRLDPLTHEAKVERKTGESLPSSEFRVKNGDRTWPCFS